MKRKSANGKRHKKNFSRTAMKEHRRNLVIPRGGFRL